ncbi:MAG: arsenosugar biosynthesis radical SAM protein ArsS [Candidatus Omnitrophica bacterium]|nr:arsenosugar biosynthesis radical SAM protein ArsS [Candidatus Omnitrophota bacterium]
MNRFDEKISVVTKDFRKRKIEILQVNVGKYCNMTCSHCHVEAGPTKTEENMDRKTAEAVIRFLDRSGIKQVDLTGGAPELNPHFDYLVTESRIRGAHVMDRCNLTVFFEKGKEYLPKFLADQRVEVIASLPCYSEGNVDKQRGSGTFDASIKALLWLNKLGYGKEGSGLILNLVYNPVGSHLPPPQDTLEKDYKLRLLEDFGAVFNRLYTITNMPITRYEKYLRAFGQYEKYVALLERSFNPQTVEGLMCRGTLSVGWDGKLYDCDFNQMLTMHLNGRAAGPQPTIFDVTLEELENREILTGNHCFGCTAGCGSSCGGAIAT